MVISVVTSGTLEPSSDIECACTGVLLTPRPLETINTEAVAELARTVSAPKCNNRGYDKEVSDELTRIIESSLSTVCDI